VKRIGNHVELSVEEKDLAVDLFQRWTRDNIIGRIPGAGRATE
jgi:hypothetical protein